MQAKYIKREDLLKLSKALEKDNHDLKQENHDLEKRVSHFDCSSTLPAVGVGSSLRLKAEPDAFVAVGRRGTNDRPTPGGTEMQKWRPRCIQRDVVGE